MFKAYGCCWQGMISWMDSICVCCKNLIKRGPYAPPKSEKVGVTRQKLIKCGLKVL